MKKNAFTMIELVFVIVVLGILAAIAIPKFAATRTDAIIAKGKSDIASIRSGIISERQSRLIQGQTSFITPANLDSGGLFGGVLTYPIQSSATEGHWYKNGSHYEFRVGGKVCGFTYSQTNGKFTLDTSYNTDSNSSLCKQLIE